MTPRLTQPNGQRKEGTSPTPPQPATDLGYLGLMENSVPGRVPGPLPTQPALLLGRADRAVCRASLAGQPRLAACVNH